MWRAGRPASRPAGAKAAALPTPGLPTTGLPTTGLPTTGLPTTGLPTTGLPTTGLPTTGLPAVGLVPAGVDAVRLGPVWLSAAIRGLGAASGGGSAVKPWSAGAGQSQPTAVAVCADVPSNS
jgi:hypothetical protein